MSDEDFIVVLVTVGSLDEGGTIAGELVRAGLAACVNRVGPVHSVYRWNGEVAEDDEYLLLIKARRQTFDALEAKVRALHSYDVPEVIALPITAGASSYLEWLATGTRGVPVGA